ncbi:hypothetical protein L0D00_26250, partial [Salmonella enterica subsp. enterica]|nr:hypothetical protein [Salmonella enterica subsp. enterica]
LAIGSAVIPPLLGGLLFWLIAPEAVASKAFLIWVLSEAIGALSFEPLSGPAARPYNRRQDAKYRDQQGAVASRIDKD